MGEAEFNHDNSKSHPGCSADPPTREELDWVYPPKFTWRQLKIFVNSGDLGLLKRDKDLQRRYDRWIVGIKEKYGSVVNYLLTYRLQWGQPDTITRLPSSLIDTGDWTADKCLPKGKDNLPIVPPGTTPYFTDSTHPGLVCIIQNDWPYSVPSFVEHTVVWTRLPILPPPNYAPDHIASKLHPKTLHTVTKRLELDGIWGFTGFDPDSPPPSPSLAPQSLGALSEWGITPDKIIRSPKGTLEEDKVVEAAGEEVKRFILRRWRESEWETAWFVNPPRLQSVQGLAHIHVFARRKGLLVIEN